ncbi:MAG: hypothetical protein JWP47_1351 [Polaromonas sp.]|nr:hypothetical protein [Polaromonas sp.]
MQNDQHRVFNCKLSAYTNPNVLLALANISFSAREKCSRAALTKGLVSMAIARKLRVALPDMSPVRPPSTPSAPVLAGIS